MKMISILITLLLIGYLINTQLGAGSSSTNTDSYDLTGSENVPKIPTSAKDVQKFQGEMETFLQNSADQNHKKLEEAL